MPAIIDAEVAREVGGKSETPGAATATTGANACATTPPPAAAEAEPAHEYKVTWSKPSQLAILKALDWGQKQATPLEVRQTQEDLWVYRAILNIIKNVNDGRVIAPIRDIAQLAIGKNASEAYEAGMAPGHIDRAAAPGGGAPAPPPTAPAPGGAAGADADSGRYVDGDGKRLAGTAAQTQEFKRMPVFLKLAIDQREIPRLLVECANSPLPLEVRQLRINVTKQSQSGGAASSTSGGGAGGSAAVRDPSTGAHKDGTAPSEAEAYEVPVEVLAIIYIYNRPDAAKLGGPATGPGAAPGATGAPPPPTGACRPRRLPLHPRRQAFLPQRLAIDELNGTANGRIFRRRLRPERQGDER